MLLPIVGRKQLGCLNSLDWNGGMDWWNGLE